MAKITIVWVLLALVISKNWKLWQMDVKNVFLHEELAQKIYMNQPKGFKNVVGIISRYMQSPKKTSFGCGSTDLEICQRYNQL